MDATYAYLAGAIDCDGSIGVKRSTYYQRVRNEANNALYQEQVRLKQVTPDIPYLLKNTFGGTVYGGKPTTDNSKPLYTYHASDRVAANICDALLPHLRVKRSQAEAVLELRASKQGKMWKVAYWFEREYPEWHELELISTPEAAKILGYSHMASVSQAIRNGTLLGLPYDYSGTYQPRIPRLLVERVAENVGKDGRARSQAPELVALRESLYQRCRELNKAGINGTPLYYKTGVYEPKG